ncbi:bifunctional imidazole glycerol-phosphate dehydratase/histidinol [Sesbania bispinosa]|nr:bifunctional imidazole glycerol-phosphate dehydratase/histidinol [Sesbania bispinosa]
MSPKLLDEVGTKPFDMNRVTEGWMSLPKQPRERNQDQEIHRVTTNQDPE